MVKRYKPLCNPRAQWISNNLLPPADELAKLNNISPKIIPWYMKQQEKQIKSSILKQFIPFTIILCALLLSFVLICLGNPIKGTIFGGGTLVTIVCSFIRPAKRIKDK